VILSAAKDPLPYCDTSASSHGILRCAQDDTLWRITNRFLLPGQLIPVGALAGATMMIVSSLFLAPSFYALPAILPVGYLIRSMRKSGSREALFGSMINSAGSVAALYVIVLLCAAPIIESRLSASHILDKVAESGTEGTASIALINTNKYSPWWMARAWRTELSAPVTVFYIDPTEIGSERVQDVLIRAGQEKRLPAAELTNFRTVMQDGGWKWITRDRATQTAGERPTRPLITVVHPSNSFPAALNWPVP